MKITRQWLFKYAGDPIHGGWKRAQTDALGVKWPLQHGWMKRQIGREITEEIARAFELPRGDEIYHRNPWS